MLQFPPQEREDPKSDKDTPKIAIRRSPAEYYIRFRLIAAPELGTVELAKILEREMVFSPATDYFMRLREEMQPPKVFRPYDLTDRVSQAFLRQQGIWSQFHPYAGTREATKVFQNERARQTLEALLSGPHPDVVIRDVVQKRSGLGLSQSGLDEFRHYYWNKDLLRTEELAAYAAAYLHDHRIADAARLPHTPEHAMLGLYRVGVTPVDLDMSATLSMLGRGFVMEYLDATTRRGGMGRTTALRMAQEGIRDVAEQQKALALVHGNLRAEVEQFKVEVRAMENPTLLQLTEGKVPIPVGFLIEGEVKDGSQQG